MDEIIREHLALQALNFLERYVNHLEYSSCVKCECAIGKWLVKRFDRAVAELIKLVPGKA